MPPRTLRPFRPFGWLARPYLSNAHGICRGSGPGPASRLPGAQRRERLFCYEIVEVRVGLTNFDPEPAVRHLPALLKAGSTR
jgi:hypothetical protein